MKKPVADNNGRLRPLESLDLPASLYDDLIRHGVTTVEQLAAMVRGEIWFLSTTDP
jgi:hypothetical protein